MIIGLVRSKHGLLPEGQSRHRRCYVISALRRCCRAPLFWRPAHLPLRPCLIPEMKCNYPFLIELFHAVFDATASELTPR